MFIDFNTSKKFKIFVRNEMQFFLQVEYLVNSPCRIDIKTKEKEIFSD